MEDFELFARYISEPQTAQERFPMLRLSQVGDMLRSQEDFSGCLEKQ